MYFDSNDKIRWGCSVKLRIEAKEGFKVLHVTESISAKEAAILKAGLIKLFQAKEKNILLNLTNIGNTNSAILREIASLKTTAAQMDALMMIASPFEGIGDGATFEETSKKLTSPLAGLLSMEAHFQKLQQQKEQLEKKLAALGDVDVKALRKENSDLKLLVKRLENLIRQLSKNRVESMDLELNKAKSAALDRTLMSIIEQEGLLPNE